MKVLRYNTSTGTCCVQYQGKDGYNGHVEKEKSTKHLRHVAAVGSSDEGRCPKWQPGDEVEAKQHEPHRFRVMVCAVVWGNGYSIIENVRSQENFSGKALKPKADSHVVVVRNEFPYDLTGKATANPQEKLANDRDDGEVVWTEFVMDQQAEGKGRQVRARVPVAAAVRQPWPARSGRGGRAWPSCFATRPWRRPS